MNLLALDTSTDACTVALAIGDEVSVDHRVAPRQHAQILLPMIDALLTEAGLARSALDGIAFGRGPGSFTGVRIAASVTQGIALGLDIGVVGISTLAAIAEGCRREHGDTQVGVALDARLDEIYWGAFTATGGVMQACVAERVCAAERAVFADGPPDIAGTASESDRGQGEWTLTGAGAERYPEELRTALGLAPDAIMRADRFPHASDILTLAQRAIAEHGLDTPDRAVPVYLRERVALTEAERGVRN